MQLFLRSTPKTFVQQLMKSVGREYGLTGNHPNFFASSRRFDWSVKRGSGAAATCSGRAPTSTSWPRGHSAPDRPAPGTETSTGTQVSLHDINLKWFQLRLLLQACAIATGSSTDRGVSSRTNARTIRTAETEGNS